MKNYLNYKLAKKFAEFLEVKELEFETDIKLFVDENECIYDYDNLNYLEHKDLFNITQSYTFEDVIDFFIEKFNVHIEILYSKLYKIYVLNARIIEKDFEEFINKSFDTKHKAIEYGIEKVIEILTEKEND